MRTLAIVLAAALVPATAAPAPPTVERTLSASEITKYFAPYVSDVRSCYLANASTKDATGELRLELVIHRDGSVIQLDVTAPGVTEPSLTRLDRCLRANAAEWHFPVRPAFTTAELPFLFVRTYAPNAGPIESCWNPNGCR